MLVLSRKAGESIVVGNDVVITVIEFRGDQVRIGVDAPRSIQVYRHELYEEISRENRLSASVAPGDLTGLPGRPGKR